MNLTEQLAKFFRSRPRKWVDGRRLARVAGVYGWRTRVSELRRAPHSMTVKNKQRRIRRAAGSCYVESMYRYVPTRGKRA